MQRRMAEKQIFTACFIMAGKYTAHLHNIRPKGVQGIAECSGVGLLVNFRQFVAVMNSRFVGSAIRS